MSLIQKANQVTADGLEAAKELNRALSLGAPLKTAFPASSLGEQLLLAGARTIIADMRQLKSAIVALRGW